MSFTISQNTIAVPPPMPNLRRPPSSIATLLTPSSYVKSRLNIPDISFAAPAAASSSSAAPAVAAEEDDAPPPAAEKSLFTLKLQSFEAASKPKIIKEVKSMLGLSLVDSKKFVESAPKVLKEGVSKEEGEKIVAAIKALGGVVAME
jgi:large subunit ribosomal protein L7/L12